MILSKAFNCLFLSEKSIYIYWYLFLSTNSVSEQTPLWSEIKAGKVLRSKAWHLYFEVPTSLGTSLGSSFILLALSVSAKRSALQTLYKKKKKSHFVFGSCFSTSREELTAGSRSPGLTNAPAQRSSGCPGQDQGHQHTPGSTDRGTDTAQVHSQGTEGISCSAQM